MDESGAKPVLPSVRGLLRAIGSVVLPSPEALDEAGWMEAEAIMEGALVSRPPGVKRQLRLFLRLVNLLPLLRTGRTLLALPMDRRATFLDGLQRSPVMLLRRGFWGVRTLLFMGYYNQDRVREGIGCGARLRGWTAEPAGDPESREEGEGDPESWATGAGELESRPDGGADGRMDPSGSGDRRGS